MKGWMEALKRVQRTRMVNRSGSNFYKKVDVKGWGNVRELFSDKFRKAQTT